VFSLAFCLALAPWTIRNFRMFHLFQPLAPAHAEMPGEFVPRGYLSWLRTWIDDGRYIDPVLWSLDERPIQLETIPDKAFDSAEEKQRVAALLEKYNHPPEEPAAANAPPDSEPSPPLSEDQSNQSQESESSKTEDESAQDKGSDEADQDDQSDQSDENAPADQRHRRAPSPKPAPVRGDNQPRMKAKL